MSHATKQAWSGQVPYPVLLCGTVHNSTPFGAICSDIEAALAGPASAPLRAHSTWQEGCYTAQVRPNSRLAVILFQVILDRFT